MRVPAMSAGDVDRRFRPDVGRPFRSECHGPSYAAAYTAFSTSDFGEQLHVIGASTLIATGEHDIGSNTRMARSMPARIAGSRLESRPGLRHSILVEAPELITRPVRDFLRS